MVLFSSLLCVRVWQNIYYKVVVGGISSGRGVCVLGMWLDHRKTSMLTGESDSCLDQGFQSIRGQNFDTFRHSQIYFLFTLLDFFWIITSIVFLCCLKIHLSGISEQYLVHLILGLLQSPITAGGSAWTRRHGGRPEARKSMGVSQSQLQTHFSKYKDAFPGPSVLGIWDLKQKKKPFQQ